MRVPAMSTRTEGGTAGAAAERPVIEVRGLTAGYRREAILDAVDLTVYEGDFLVILGPNGGGKTTLLKVLLGVLAPWRGSVAYHLPHGGRRLGYVPQFSTFEPGFPLRVEEVALMGRLALRPPGRRYRSADREAARAALDEVRLGHRARAPVGELSGGQVQRLLLARALAGEPEALLLDEPMASLDAESREVVRGLLLELRRRMPIVLVTHDPTAVAPDIRHIACLNRRLTYHGAGEVPVTALEEAYGCPVEMIAHGVPHRVLAPHGSAGGSGAGPAGGADR